jgi:hypothetical protein
MTMGAILATIVVGGRAGDVIKIREVNRKIIRTSF